VKNDETKNIPKKKTMRDLQQQKMNEEEKEKPKNNRRLIPTNSGQRKRKSGVD